MKSGLLLAKEIKTKQKKILKVVKFKNKYQKMLITRNKMLNQNFMLPIQSICNKMPTQFYVAYSKLVIH